MLLRSPVEIANKSSHSAKTVSWTSSESSSTSLQSTMEVSVQWSDFQIDSILDKSDIFLTYKVTLDTSVGSVVAYDIGSETTDAFSAKRLKKKGSRIDMQKWMKDLEVEANILKKLKHPHIVRGRGVSNASSLAEVEEPSFQYFLLTELLQDTLQDRLSSFKSQAMTKASSGLLFTRKSTAACKGVPDLPLRMRTIGLPLASALKCLHAQGIALNRLNPAVVAFDGNGILKIRDFSMATSRRCPNRSSELPTRHGRDLRYLSPEQIKRSTMLGKDKGNRKGILVEDSFASDVYSLSVMLWETVTLETPYSFVDRLSSSLGKKRMLKIAESKRRPNLRLLDSKPLRKLIQQGWSSSNDRRPSSVRFWVDLQQIFPNCELQKQAVLSCKLALGRMAPSGNVTQDMPKKAAPRRHNSTPRQTQTQYHRKPCRQVRDDQSVQSNVSRSMQQRHRQRRRFEDEESIASSMSTDSSFSGGDGEYSVGFSVKTI